MRNTVSSGVYTAFSALVIVACGGTQQPAQEPTSQAETTGVVVESGPASPGDPAGSLPQRPPHVTSGSVASPMEGECPRGQPHADTFDRKSCVKSCQGQDETVQPGSTCVSQWVSCAMQCQQWFPNR